MPAKAETAESGTAPRNVSAFIYVQVDSADGPQTVGVRLYGTTGTMEPVRCLFSPDDAATAYEPGTPEHAAAEDLLTALAGFVETVTEIAKPEKRPAEDAA